VLCPNKFLLLYMLRLPILFSLARAATRAAEKAAALCARMVLAVGGCWAVLTAPHGPATVASLLLPLVNSFNPAVVSAALGGLFYSNPISLPARRRGFGRKRRAIISLLLGVAKAADNHFYAMKEG